MRLLLIISFLHVFVLTKAQSSYNVDLINQWNGDWVDTNNAGIKYNEVWGFMHNGEEYGVIGSVNGTHFFRLTADDELIEIDFIPGKFQGHVVHRDYHDYNGYLYGVCQQGGSSLQIMDLSYLPDSVSLVYDEDSLFSVAHNVFIDTSSALLYVAYPERVGMEVYTLQNPIDPQLVYDYEFFPYVHDIYARNDSVYLSCGDDGLWVYDFSNPAAPVNLGSITSYPEQGFNHSGWLSEDGNTYIMTDETEGKKLKVVDVSDLSDINIHSIFGTEWWPGTIPHNVMFFNGIAYISYYNDGLQIYDIRDVNSPKQIGFYDTFSGNNDKIFQGAWGIYARFPSGKLLVSDRSSGLFVFREDIPPNVEAGHGIYPNPAEDQAWFHKEHGAISAYTVQILSLDGKLIDELSGLTDYLRIDLTDYPAGGYLYRYINDITGTIESGKFIRIKP